MSSAEHGTATLTRRSALDRLTAVMALALALPPLLAVLFWGVAPPHAGPTAAGWLSAGYGLCAGAMLLAAGRLALARVMRDGAGRRDRPVQALRRFSAWGLAALCAHVAFSNAAVLSAGAAPGAAVPPETRQVLLVGVIQLLLAGLPVAVYGYGVLGVLYGPSLAHRPAVPTGSRLLVLGLLLPLLAASVVPVYQLRSGSALGADVMAIWGAVLGYVLVLFSVAYRNQMRGLAPLQRLLDADDPQTLEPIAAASLDDLGVCVNRLRDLLITRAGAERALNDSENRTRMFAEAASDYLYEMDENLRFTFVSERFEELTGIPVSLVIGQSATDLGRAHITDQRRSHLEDLLAHRPYRDYRYSVKTREGRMRHLQLRGLPFFDEAGRFRGYRGAGTDVTDFVETQQRLLEKEAELGQAQNMKALGQLTGGVAHDFNNALTTFIGNLELALVDGVPAAAGRRIQAALDSAQASAVLVQRLLAFSRRQALRPEPVDMARLLESLSDMARPLLGERVRLTVVPGDRTAVALADPDQLRQALANLLINARDAMPDGGEVTVTVEVESGDPAGLAAGDYVRVVVADTGPGIDRDHLMFVFEPFFTTKPPGRGSGLGLSMVYGFVSQSGGRVRIDSDGGVRVELLLPAAGDRRSVAAPPAAFSGTAGGRRLLVVEDDPSLAVVVAQMLRDLDYEVASVASGEAAVAFLNAHPDVDLAVCDVILSGTLNGLDVVRQARSSGHRARWLLMSGYVLADDHLRQADLAGCQVLRKPFRSRELAERVAEVLGRGPLDRSATAG